MVLIHGVAPTQRPYHRIHKPQKTASMYGQNNESSKKCLLTDHCSPLRVRLGCEFVGVVPGDDGMLDVTFDGASPLMIS